MITLTRKEVSATDAIANRHAWPIEVTAVSDDEADLSAKVFVYHAGVIEKFGDGFECIASLMQMTELPADSPVIDGEGGYDVPYFRKNVCKLNTRSAEHAAQLWKIIKEDVKELIDNHNMSKKLSVAEVVEIS